MNTQLSVQDWLELPMDTRITLRVLFGIPRSQGSIVESDKVVSDGTTYKDLESLTSDKMAEYLTSEEDGRPIGTFTDLFTGVLAKVDLDKELEPPVEEKADPKELILNEWIAVLSRLKGQAVEYSMQDYLKTAVTRIFEIKPLTPQPNAETAKKGSSKTKKTK